MNQQQQQFEYSQGMMAREHQLIGSAVSGDSAPPSTGHKKIKSSSGSFVSGLKGSVRVPGESGAMTAQQHQRVKSKQIMQHQASMIQRNTGAPNTIDQQASQQLDGSAGPLGPQKPSIMHPQQLQYVQNVKSSVSSPNGQQAQAVRSHPYPQGVYGSAQSHQNNVQHRQHLSGTSSNSNQKQTPKQMMGGGAYSVQQNVPMVLKSESSAGHIKFSEPSSSIGMNAMNAGNVPSSFQSSFAGLPKVNNQTQQNSLQHQQEQLRQQLYGASVAQSIELASSGQKLPGAGKLSKKRIKSSGKLAGQTQATAAADESQYANLPTSSQQSFANVPSEHGNPLRASQNVMGQANHQRIQSNPVVLKDINQFVSSQGGSDLRKQVAVGSAAGLAKQPGSFQSSAGMAKANQKRAIQTRERMGQILDTGSVNHQQQVLGHAKYLGASMQHQAQTAQASGGSNSLAQSTTGLNKVFSKVLHSLGSDGAMISRQEAVNTQNMLVAGAQKGVVKTAHANGPGMSMAKASGNVGNHKIKSFNGVTTSHHQKALSMQSYMMQPKQLTSQQHAQAAAGKKVGGTVHSGNSIGVMPSTAAAGGSHQSTTGARKKTLTSQQLSFANDPHVVNTMMAAPGTAHTQQRAELFSHAALPGAGPNLVGPAGSGARTTHQSSMNAIGNSAKGTLKTISNKTSTHMTPGAGGQGGNSQQSQFNSKLQAARGPKPHKQQILQQQNAPSLQKPSHTSPRTSMNISQSISPSQMQYKAANLKQPHHRHTNTAGAGVAAISQKAALLQQQILLQPQTGSTVQSHRRQGTLDFSSGQLDGTPVSNQGNAHYQKSSQNIAMTNKLTNNQPMAKKHDGPIVAAAGDTSSVPASLANSSHYIRAPPSVATGANTSMSKQVGSNSAIHSSGTHRRIKSDQVELLGGGQSQYDAPIHHGQAQSSQIVVINNNNTFEFQMHGTNINIHHNHPSNYNFSVANNNANDIDLAAHHMQEQMGKQNHYFKLGGNNQPIETVPQQSRKSMQKAKYERLMKGDRDGSEMAPLKSATQTQKAQSYAQSKSILGASQFDGAQFAISQSIDVSSRGMHKPQTYLNSGRPPSTSAASVERQRHEQRHGRREEAVSAPRSIDQSATRSKLKQQDNNGQSRVGSAKRALHSRQKTIQRGASGNSKKQVIAGPGHVKAASHADGFFGQAAAKGLAAAGIDNPHQKLTKRKSSNSKQTSATYVAQTGSRKNQPMPNNGDKQGMIVNSAERSSRKERAHYIGQEGAPGQEVFHSNYVVTAGQGMNNQYQSTGNSSKVMTNNYASLNQGHAGAVHYKQMSASNLQSFQDNAQAAHSNKMYMLRQPEQPGQQPNNYINNQERPSAVTASQRTLMQHQHLNNQVVGTAHGARPAGLIQSHQGPINYVGKHKKMNSTAVPGSGQQKLQSNQLYQIVSNPNIEQKGPKLQGPPGVSHLQQMSKTPEKLVMSAQAIKNAGHQKLASQPTHIQEPYIQNTQQARQQTGQMQVNSAGAIQAQSSSQFLKKIKGGQVRREVEDDSTVKHNLISGLNLSNDRQSIESNSATAHQQKLLAKNRLVQSDLQQRRAGANSQISMSRRSAQSNELGISDQQITQKKPVEKVAAWKTDPEGRGEQLTPRKQIFNNILLNISNKIFVTKIDYYKIGKVIGKGAFGKVNLAIHRLTGKFVALKSINKTFMSDESSLKKVMQEYNILKRARHKNIVRLYESFETEQHIVYVMEVCGGGDLLTYVRRRRKLKEDLAKFVFRQLIQGISYVNSKRVLHRDIKLDNILLTSEGDVKICDFGVSKLVQSATATQTEQCGTPAYIAPEVFKGRGYRGFQSDIWSAGVVLYAMLFGTVPFKATNMAELQKQIIKVDCSWGQPGEISAPALSLLQRILEVDPNKRLTPQQIMSDPWMMLTEQQARQIEVFTEHEKKKIVSEFEYYNQKKEVEEGSKADDPFLEQMLQTTQNSLMKNNTTKSVILAPFNSTKSHISDDFYLADEIQDILVTQSALTFQDRCREVNRQYMLNNNAELDNGVYNEQDEKKKEDEQPEDKAKKQDDGLTGLDQQIDNLQPTPMENIDGTVTPVLDSNLQSQLQSLNTSQQMVDADRVERMEEQFGYEYNYVIEQLEGDQLNHCTTTYFLIDTEKEF